MEMTNAQRDLMIERLCKSKEGLFKLGASLQSPVRQRMDHHPITRRVFVVDPLNSSSSGNQMLPIYDVDKKGRVVIATGSKIKRKKGTTRILVPEFDLWVNVVTTRDKLKDVSDIIVEKLGKEESKLFFKLLKEASKVSKQRISYSNLTKGLHKAIDTVCQHDFKTQFIIMHPSLIDQFSKEDITNLDICTHKELIRNGLYGNLWGNDVLLTKHIPKKTIYICAEPEFLGVIPIRQDPQVFVTSKPKCKHIKLYIVERLGMAILNPKGVCQLKLIK